MKYGLCCVTPPAGCGWATSTGSAFSIRDPLLFIPGARPGIDAERCRSIAESKDGYIWIGTANGRLIQVNRANLRATQQTFTHIFRVFTDSRDRVWLVTANGLMVSDPGKARNFVAIENPLLGRPAFYDVAEGPDGRIWAISARNLFSYDGAAWHRFDLTPERLGRHLSDLAVQQSGDVWLDGLDAGLVRLHVASDRIAGFDRSKGSANEILFLHADRRGWIWLGGDHGVQVFDGKNWRRYTEDDGLIWNDCDSKAFFEDVDGSVWIGTSGGVSHLLTPGLSSIGPPPAPIFVRAKFGSKDILGQRWGAEVEWQSFDHRPCESEFP